MSSAREMLWTKKTRGPRTGTLQHLINKDNGEMLSDKFGENQERRVCWRNSPFPFPPFSGLFSALRNSFLGAVSPRLPCLGLMLGSANERRERSDICPWFLLLCCSFTVVSFFWHQLCILVWVKKYIEEKKKSKREYVLMNFKRHSIQP